MITRLVSTSQKWLRKTVSAYRASREGVAAIEFAFVAPIMIVMYIGLAELSLLISEDRRVSHAANVAGDLTTQESSISRDGMAEIMNAVLLTLDTPDNDNSVKIEITSYFLDASGNVDENGQATFGGAFGTPYDPNSIDPRLLNATSGVVVARVSYDYDFALLGYNKDNGGASPLENKSHSVTLTDTFLLKPRTATQVTFDADSGGSTTYTCNRSGGTVSC